MSVQGVGDAWVANEFHAVQRAGIPCRLHALRRTTRKLFASSWAARLNDETRVIYPIPAIGIAKAVIAAPFRFGRRFWSALGNALFGHRESLRNRLAGIGHLVVSCYWAAQLRRDAVDHIHSQWIHSGGTVAMYGAWLLGKTFSFTGHAADLFRERVALKDKIRRASFIVCISEFHRGFFLEQGASEEQLHIVYCGIDVNLFTPKFHSREANEPYQIRSSGRLVEKKGFDDLIRACAILRDRGIDFRCKIAGSGPMADPLASLIRELNLDGMVEVTNRELQQEQIPQFMHESHVYCLPCVWAKDRDVDGLPQMLMEAMACGLPAISTRLVGIPDLVIDEKTGLLVEPGKPAQLADALVRLHDDPALASQLAKAGRKWCEERFEINNCLTPLLEIFRARLSNARTPESALV